MGKSLTSKHFSTYDDAADRYQSILQYATNIKNKRMEWQLRESSNQDGGDSMECQGATITWRGDTCIGKASKLSGAVSWMEALQFVAGIWDVSVFPLISSVDISMFSAKSAYGWYLRTDNWTKCLKELLFYPTSRRAITSLGATILSEKVSTSVAREYTPCTMTLHLLVDNKTNYQRPLNPSINLIAHMRSLDLVRGLPTDMAMFSQFLCRSVAYLNQQKDFDKEPPYIPGTITILANTAHVYINSFDILEKRLAGDIECLQIYMETLKLPPNDLIGKQYSDLSWSLQTLRNTRILQNIVTNISERGEYLRKSQELLWRLINVDSIGQEDKECQSGLM